MLEARTISDRRFEMLMENTDHERDVRHVAGACCEMEETGILEASYDLFGKPVGRDSHCCFCGDGLVC